MTTKNVVYRKLKSVDLESLKRGLSDSLLCSDPPDLQVHLHSEDLRDLDALVRRYNTTLSKVIDCHAPLKTKTVKVRPAVPWYNDDIKAAKRLRHKAERTGHPSRCPPPTQVWGNHLKELSRNRLRIGGPKCSLAWGEALQTLVQKGQPESVPTESCGKNFF